MGEGLKRARKAARDTKKATGVETLKGVRLVLRWTIDADDIALEVMFIDLDTGESKHANYTATRFQTASLVESLRVRFFVEAFALLVRKARPECTEEHITHSVNAAALLMSVLDTKVHTSRFEWREA